MEEGKGECVNSGFNHLLLTLVFLTLSSLFDTEREVMDEVVF